MNHAMWWALQEQVCHDRKFDTVVQLKQAIVLERHALPLCFIDHSTVNGVVCIVSWTRMTDTCISLTVLSVELLLQMCWNIFWSTS